MGSVLRYTLLRILVFFGVLSVLWLLGLRSADQRLLLVAASLVLSMVVSFFLLRPFREDMSATIARRVEERRAAEAEEE